MGMFPAMNGKSKLGVKIPSLSGGINEADAANLIEDNQLTDVSNMWFYDGMLRTRPGFTTSANSLFKLASPNNGSFEGFEYIPNNVTKLIDGKYHKLVAAKITTENLKYIAFWYVGSDGNVIRLDDIVPEKLIDLREFESIENAFLTQHKEFIYVYVKEKYLDGDTEKHVPEYEVYRIKDEEKDGKWEKVTEFDVPVTQTNCKATNETGYYSGDNVRSYNVLNGGEKIEYHAFYEKRRIDLQLDFILKVGTTISMKILRNDGTTLSYCCEVTGGEDYSELEINKTALKVETDKTFHSTHIVLEALVEGEMIAFLPPDIGEEYSLYQSDQPNVTLTYYREVTEEEKDRIFMAIRCEWYGTQGLNGGSRLFVAGNKREELKNLVHFSDTGSPTYFPENCYMRIGDGSQRITALAKQSDMLVFFSERQIHCTVYQSGSDITAESFTEGGQYDLTVLKAVFPITQIHAHIGCDCPDTVQLCRNRLVWTTSEGKVYTLLGANQYSERNVFELSRNIEHSLRENLPTDLRYAKACDWESRYMLHIGNKIFVMHYEDNGFSYVASYSDSKQAQKNIAWYVWHVPHFEHIYADSGRLIAISRGERWNTVYVCDCTAENDIIGITDEYGDSITFTAEERGISSLLQTKVFDFKNPSIKKIIEQVYIGFGGNGEREITVTFFSDKGEETKYVLPTHSDIAPSLAGFVHTQRFLPGLTHVTRIGIKIESGAKLAIDNIAINYRLLGGVR